MSQQLEESLDDIFFDQRAQNRKNALFPVTARVRPTAPVPPPPLTDNDMPLSQLFDCENIILPSQNFEKGTKSTWPSFARQKPTNMGFGLSKLPDEKTSHNPFSQPHKTSILSTESSFPCREICEKITSSPKDVASESPPMSPEPTSSSKTSFVFPHGRSSTTMKSRNIGIPARYHRPPGGQSGPMCTPRQQNHHTTDTLETPGVLTFEGRTPGGSSNGQNKLRSVEEISQQWRVVFDFPYFNIVQSKVIDDVLYTDKPVVVCAPTGSGKTVIFEIAIIRLLMMKKDGFRPKVVYMAPIKALCSEKCDEWKRKFGPLGLKCQELTGDTEMDNFFELQTVDIIMTTPEKWDSMTRRWRDNRSLVQQVKLFLIDEIHILNDESRGPVLEAVVSRMKTVQESIKTDATCLTMRFLAISATIPNINDVAEWLSTNEKAVHYKLDESYRPVELRKVVLGFPCSETQSDFKFDLTLNYKLSGIIQTYSDQKPALVFCATRKGVQQAAATLVKDARFIMNGSHKQRMQSYANKMRDSKLRDLIMYGVGYHHAGLEYQDRKNVEEMFLAGDLPVLMSTSTLAMGVNLPAHLVVIKSTQHYVMGVYQEYSETQVLQMIGRAGRPQFDSSATAVIMTKHMTKNRYEDLLNGRQMIESSLHTHLIENMNAEVVLRTITDVSVALEWIKSTFLYIRVTKNPRHYGLSSGLSTADVEQKLQDWCLKSLNELGSLNLIEMNEDCDTKPTESGRLMARYCIAFETMKLFSTIKGQESIKDLILKISKCKEFSDIKLRMNERKALNTMNKDKNRTTIRYPMEGKIKTTEMKVNCLIQAQLGCLSIQDFTLNQDINRIYRAGQRVTKCLMEFLWHHENFRCLLNAVLLGKCFKARLWENSRYVAKQLEGIGPALSTALVNAGMDNFQKIDDTNPRQLEMIMNRHPPFGNTVRSAVDNLPRYELSIEQISRYSSNRAELMISICLANSEQLAANPTAGLNHTCALIIGDSDNKTVAKIKLSDSILVRMPKWSKRLDVFRASRGEELSINLISESWVGIDVQSTYTPFYSGPKHITSKGPSQPREHSLPQTYIDDTPHDSQKDDVCQDITNMLPPNCRPCAHKCTNKKTCAHDCCKFGIPIKRVKKPIQCKQIEFSDPSVARNNATASHMETLRHKRNSLPQSPALKRLKTNHNSTPSLGQYAYSPKLKMDFGRNNKYTASPSARVTPTYATPIGATPTARVCDELSMYKPTLATPTKVTPTTARPTCATPTARGWDELSMYQRTFATPTKVTPTSATPTCATPTARGWDELSMYQQKRNMEGNFSYDDTYIDSESSSSPTDVYVVEDFQHGGDSLEELPVLPSKPPRDRHRMRPVFTSQTQPPAVETCCGHEDLEDKPMNNPNDDPWKTPKNTIRNVNHTFENEDVEGLPAPFSQGHQWSRPALTPKTMQYSNEEDTFENEDFQDVRKKSIDCQMARSRNQFDNIVQNAFQRAEGTLPKNHPQSSQSERSMITSSTRPIIGADPSLRHGSGGQARKFTFSRKNLLTNTGVKSVSDRRMLEYGSYKTRQQEINPGIARNSCENQEDQHKSPAISSDDDELLCDFLSKQEADAPCCNQADTNTQVQCDAKKPGKLPAAITSDGQRNLAKNRTSMMPRNMFTREPQTSDQVELDEAETAFNSIFDGIF